MNRKLYPLGIQTFEKIRKEDRFYVDKTTYVYNLAHTDSTYVFLSRPRRFGKSLLVSTLKSYFEGRRDLFAGLAIDSLEKEWTEYPVLHFDMSGGKHMEKAQLERYLLFLLSINEKQFGVECDSQDTNVRMDNLIRTVYEKTGRQVVVLIDEYDAPLLDVVHIEEQLPVLRNVMRNFYSPLKKCDPMLRFVFLTGITKFSQLSIFSELNNINNISMDTPYAGICGITESELLTQMSDDIGRLAEANGTTREEAIARLKDNYDGYHFTWPSEDIYNPFSLLNCFADNKFNAYWFGSGTPTYLIEMMRKFNCTPTELGEQTEAGRDDFDAATETMTTLTPLLYQSGYVTIKDYDPETELYTLAIPNKEIRVGLFRTLLPHYVSGTNVTGTTTIAKMSKPINEGNIDSALELLRKFLASVPYCNNTDYEGHYQQMMYIMFALLTPYRINVEQHTAKGRTDITLETRNFVYVIELKFGATPQDALQQINRQRYADAFALTGKETVKVGINFEVKDGVMNIDWITE